jgi:DNA/RNA-binding domain of Phe-tRNA-synthetase-like protein
MKPTIVRSRHATAPLRKYATSPEAQVRVRAAIAALPADSLYRDYLSAQLEPQPRPYVPSAEALASRVEWLEQQLAGVRR